jgi:hypothetical protein
MKTKLTCKKLLPGVAIPVSERNEVGALVGFWKGFWFPRSQVVRLYPACNPFCVWQVARTPKNVSDVLIHVEKDG